jgi:glycerophosphoryl diester phosphodiesterase
LNSGRPVVRIAHAYGNRRDTLETALRADIDMIEVDLWFRRGQIEARHEKRMRWAPVLFDKRPVGMNRIGPWAIGLPWRRYLRLDLRPRLLRDLLRMTAGSKRLLLDVKEVSSGPAEAYVSALKAEIAEAEAASWITVCGQFWPVLDRVREVAPEIAVAYSMQRESQWQEYTRRLATADATRTVCMQHGMLNDEKGAFLEENGVDVYSWTVDDRILAGNLVHRGVDGIISNDLALLADLGKRSESDRSP